MSEFNFHKTETLLEAFDTIHNQEEICNYLKNFFYSINSDSYYQVGRGEIYHAILSHPEYNTLKDKWLPIPKEEELKLYKRKKNISLILN